VPEKPVIWLSGNALGNCIAAAQTIGSDRQLPHSCKMAAKWRRARRQQDQVGIENG